MWSFALPCGLGAGWTVSKKRRSLSPNNTTTMRKAKKSANQAGNRSCLTGKPTVKMRSFACGLKFRTKGDKKGMDHNVWIASTFVLNILINLNLVQIEF